MTYTRMQDGEKEINSIVTVSVIFISRMRLGPHSGRILIKFGRFNGLDGILNFFSYLVRAVLWVRNSPFPTIVRVVCVVCEGVHA